MKNTVVVLASGKGVRFGGTIEKQFYKLGEKGSVLEYTLDNLKKTKLFDEYILVVQPKHFMKVEEILKGMRIKNYIITTGGSTRNESFINGIREATGDKIVVHDAVRPLTPKSLFEGVLNGLEKYDVVTVARPIAGNLIKLKSPDDSEVEEIVNRDYYLEGEAPTAYTRKARDVIIEAYEKDHSIIYYPHDIQIAKKLGLSLGVFRTTELNPKITYLSDLELIMSLLNIKKK